MRTRIKICGIRQPADGEFAARHGADAIGLVFYDKSPRAVDAARASAIVAELPPFVTAVGLFVDASAAQVKKIRSEVSLGLLQFHGDESPEYCRQFGCPYIKAVRMREGVDLAKVCAQFSGAAGLLLDSYSPTTPGGTGESFDWARIPEQLSLPIILAGGLTPANVARAATKVRPFGVDVSGGVEKSKGEKDHSRIVAFIEEVKRVDQQSA